MSYGDGQTHRPKIVLMQHVWGSLMFTPIIPNTGGPNMHPSKVRRCTLVEPMSIVKELYVNNMQCHLLPPFQKKTPKTSCRKNTLPKVQKHSCRDILPLKTLPPKKARKQATMHTPMHEQTSCTSQCNAFMEYLPSLHLSNTPNRQVKDMICAT